MVWHYFILIYCYYRIILSIICKQWRRRVDTNVPYMEYCKNRRWRDFCKGWLDWRTVLLFRARTFCNTRSCSSLRVRSFFPGARLIFSRNSIWNRKKRWYFAEDTVRCVQRLAVCKVEIPRLVQSFRVYFDLQILLTGLCFIMDHPRCQGIHRWRSTFGHCIMSRSRATYSSFWTCWDTSESFYSSRLCLANDQVQPWICSTRIPIRIPRHTNFHLSTAQGEINTR